MDWAENKGERGTSSFHQGLGDYPRPVVVYCDLCLKPAKLTFTQPNGRQMHRCNRHSKPLLALQKHGTMAIPQGHR